MKKSFSVNIGYRLFNIDEDAYERLQQYLDRVRLRLNASDSDEVIRDIEIRVAELLSGRLTPSKEVIVIDDIEFVIQELGEPEQIEDFSDDQQQQDAPRDERSLYRDVDDRILGGVCAGLSEFFDVEALWVRIAFVVLFLLGGSGLLIYLILWLVVPAARSSADKLRMKGKKVNVNNLSNRIREEFDHVRDSFRKGPKSKKRPQSSNSNRPSSKSVVESDAFRWVVYIGAMLTGLFLISFALIMIGGFTLALFSDFAFWGNVHLSGATISPMDMIFNLATSPLLGWIGIVSILAIVLIPLLSMVIIGLRLIFRFKFPVRMYNRIAATVWGVSLGVFAAVMIYHAIYYSKTTYESKTLTIPQSEAIVEFSVQQNATCLPVGDDENEHLMFMDNADGSGVMLCLQPDVELIPELYDSSFRMVVHVRNSGQPAAVPFETCQPMVLDSAHVLIPAYVPFQKGSIRNVTIEVYVPVGRTIVLSEEMKKLLHRNHRLDEMQMGRRHFTMTHDGLRPSPTDI